MPMAVMARFSSIEAGTGESSTSCGCCLVPAVRALIGWRRSRARRGTRATVFQGLDGLDELSTVMPSVVYEVHDHEVRKHTIDPDDLELTHARITDLHGGDVEENAAIARRVLAGEKDAKRDVVLLNAAAALQVAGAADSLIDGIGQAAESIDGGKAEAILIDWAALSQTL